MVAMKKNSCDYNFDHFIKDPERRVKSLVSKITHSGETELVKDDLEELKNLCKHIGDSLISVVYKACMKNLHKNHSQVRVTTVKLINYLFNKSHIFRDKLLTDFDIFFELTLAITQNTKLKLNLPPPKKYAALLKELSVKCLHKWHADFGAGYEKLRYAHKFLREHRLVDFSQFQVNTHEQLLKRQELLDHQERILTRSIENRLRELKELKPDIDQLIVQIESLLEILVPSDNWVCDTTSNGRITNKQHHGIANLCDSIEIDFSPFVNIKESPENEIVLQNLRDLKRDLTTNKLIKLVSIEKTISKRSEQFVSTLKEIINLKTRSTHVVMKLSELKLIEKKDDSGRVERIKNLDQTYSDSEEDFQEVESKADMETYIPKRMRYEYGLEPIDPKELSATNHVIHLSDESFNLDASTSGSLGGINSGLVLPCNVKLESGKLCPRRDKIKCPFHGKIIPRDHNGFAIDETIREEEEIRAKQKDTVPEWQNPQLLAEIRAATGVDLTMPKKRLAKRKLVNSKTCDQTPKQRLQKKLKSLMK